ncbi:class I SAM-dependent methyltransferase [Desulfoluna butyratoxydans]|uniref:S-adenosyl-l-methionine-dependent methyltransferase n=1 Tax=Desulfoluna butyratoxydans TaxID=231438 RepID=A0A4U8YRV5_9BACT|nr:class I SAM-dependent methyltransferase [Desulfoluna butyratoxydans]VFQ47115.1 s-adenosyl-l-methionine-dependent methyltransferase [Desulfoluna butyratoxydans]
MNNLCWKTYCHKTNDIPPRPTLVKALSFFDHEPFHGAEKIAVDLGCGAGGDCLSLLTAGWSVFAVDKEPEAIRTVEEKAAPHANHLKTRVSLFEEIQSLPTALLVNASLSLPFCRPEAFHTLWKIVASSIQPGGRFAGTLFGDRDEWSANTAMTFLSVDQVYGMFSGFKMEHFHERDEMGPTATAGDKHWHSYSVVAKKIHPTQK